MRTVVIIFAAILLSLWTGGGSAEAQTPSHADLARAVEAYAAADFRRAEMLLEQVDSGSLSDRDRAIQKMYQGFIHLVFEQEDRARTAFMEAVEADPEVRPDPSLHSPERITVYEAAREEVRGRQRVELPRTYNVGSVLFSSIIPGVGQIRTGNRVRGFLTMAAAAGAAAFGVFSEEYHQLCAVPAQGTCPEADVLDAWVEKPYQAVGLGAAAAVTLLGAIDATLTASRSNRQAEAQRSRSGVGAGSSLRLGAAPQGVRIGLELRF